MRALTVVLLLVLPQALVTAEAGLGWAERLAAIETDEARAALRDDVLEAELWRVREARIPPVFQRTYGTMVAVTSRQRDGLLSTELVVSPQSSGGRHRGAFTLFRSLEDGRALRFRIATREEPGCYLEVTPAGDRSTMDVFLLGSPDPLYGGVMVPAPFGELLTSSLERIVDLTSAKVDWTPVFYAGAQPEDRLVENLAASIRASLPGLRDMDDGAIDEGGRFVFISTSTEQPRPGGLNCSGFVKWIVDGFVYPLLGRNTSVKDAKAEDEARRRSSLAQSLESLDPYFGLDWTRNLAGLLDDARRGMELRRPGTRFDVRSAATATYVEDVGYPVEALERLLYRETMMHPGSFYLGSVNDTVGPSGLRQHFHTLAILPYFDGAGEFRVRVFERVRESSLAGIVGRYRGACIHLVRIRAEGAFSPLDLP